MSYDLNQEIAYRPRLCNRARLLACPERSRRMPISPIKFRALKAAERLQLWRFVTGRQSWSLSAAFKARNLIGLIGILRLRSGQARSRALLQSLGRYAISWLRS